MGAMNKRYYLELLQQAWIDFLQRRGHEISLPEQIIDVITSYCEGHNSFRWLLFATERQVKRLTPSERRQLAREIEAAREQGQKPYVVVRFAVPKSKIIIKPAEKALETGYIDSARGGIPWFE
jgi:hypothetical protein